MIDITDAINDKIAEAVQEQVALLFTQDEKLLAGLRSQAVSLLVRNFNLDTVIKQSISAQVAVQVAELLVNQPADENSFLDPTVVNTTVANNVADATIDQVAKLFAYDKDLIAHLKTQAITAMVRKISIDNNVNKIIADKIADQFSNAFDGTAIHTESTQRELSVLQDLVVIENGLVARSATIKERIVANEVFVDTLNVTGTVDTDSLAWAPLASKIKTDVITSVMVDSKQAMIDAVIADADNIDFTQILLNGNVVLGGNTLGKQITTSNLQNVGQLTDLTVKGETSLAGTVYANAGRVGINTESPSSALDVWDEEVAISIGKGSAQTAFIGTSRSQDLTIGVNQRADVHIDNSGTVTVQKLKVGENTISFSNSVPNYSGKPGDLVINTGNVVDEVFGWRCTHDFSWQVLKGTI